MYLQECKICNRTLHSICQHSILLSQSACNLQSRDCQHNCLEPKQQIFSDQELLILLQILSLYLQVFYNNADIVLSLTVSIASSTNVVTTIIWLSSINCKSIVEKYSNTRASIKGIAILEPCNAWPDTTVDITWNTYEGIDREPKK